MMDLHVQVQCSITHHHTSRYIASPKMCDTRQTNFGTHNLHHQRAHPVYHPLDPESELRQIVAPTRHAPTVVIDKGVRPAATSFLQTHFATEAIASGL